MRRLNGWPIAIALLAVAADLAIVTSAPLTVRAPIVVSFLLIAPGMAFVRLLRIDRPYVELTLALALSMAIDVLVSESMMLAHVWSLGVAVAVLIFLTVVGAGLQMLTSGPFKRGAGQG